MIDSSAAADAVTLSLRQTCSARSDSVSITLAPGECAEIKLAMDEGASVVTVTLRVNGDYQKMRRLE